ncbi:MAG: hypothetical protein IT328_05300 [Caldilineaceae bacterium]|nr:hypothetical protein [Caldilineaceae bacterium]
MGISCANIASQATPHATDLRIYDDALATDWVEDWSWDSTIDLAATNIIHSGSAAIATTYNAGWAGLSLRTATPIATGGYNAVAFWVYGNGAPLSLYTQSSDDGAAGTAYALTPPAGAWTEVTVSLTELGSPPQIARINWQNESPDPQSVYYLDEIRLIANAAPPPSSSPSPSPDITLHVDVAAARKPISPYIYGMNEYSMSGDVVALMEELAIPVRRWGGNATSRYNWQTDISNHASDWFFGNVKQSDATDLPDDSAVNRFIDQNRQAGTYSFLVLPMSGYVSNDNGLACGFSVQKYGPQQATAASDSRPDCGNGKYADGSYITGNNPLETSIAIDPNFVADWVSYLVGRYGRADAGGIRFYNPDNEPDLWFETHRDVRPIGYTYDEIRDLTYQYAAAIKAVDPSAAILGPVVHGWTYYWHSPYDGQRQDWADPDDRNAHGGTPFIAWYLQQMAAYEADHGVRILDYLDMHYYPQANGVALGDAGDAATQARRLRSTRSLWDPTYVDESWIPDAGPAGGIVQLIPRMRDWVAQNYPGTKLAIGEYNWGGLEHINGALAQADVLGIFGREGVDLATMWQPPQLNQPAAFAFRIYRNYDGAGSQFGDTSVAATSSDQARLSLYAAQRSSDGALTLVIINKGDSDLSAQLTLANFTASAPAQLYRYSDANLTAIVHGAEQPITTGIISATYPTNSITLLVIPQGTQALNAGVHLPLMRR